MPTTSEMGVVVTGVPLDLSTNVQLEDLTLSKPSNEFSIYQGQDGCQNGASIAMTERQVLTSDIDGASISDISVYGHLHSSISQNYPTIGTSFHFVPQVS